jgi:predicted esterase
VRLHEGEPVLAAGAPLAEARAAIVALHGRGASAEGILDFAVAELAAGVPGLALVAPQARHATWYPRSFLAPFEENEPWLGSALARVGEVVAEVEAAGVPAEKILLFGFSQGACLASEWVARHPRRYLALVAATGGRIGPPGTPFASAGELAGTPVHLSAGDPDPHVPWSRVEESAASVRAMGGEVTMRRAPGFPHAVHPEAIAFARQRLATV